jgi:hypothetical protein
VKSASSTPRDPFARRLASVDEVRVEIVHVVEKRVRRKIGTMPARRAQREASSLVVEWNEVGHQQLLRRSNTGNAAIAAAWVPV